MNEWRCNGTLTAAAATAASPVDYAVLLSCGHLFTENQYFWYSWLQPFYCATSRVNPMLLVDIESVPTQRGAKGKEWYGTQLFVHWMASKKRSSSHSLQVILMHHNYLTDKFRFVLHKMRWPRLEYVCNAACRVYQFITHKKWKTKSTVHCCRPCFCCCTSYLRALAVIVYAMLWPCIWTLINVSLWAAAVGQFHQ